MGNVIRYEPFGDYRAAPSSGQDNISDRSYTGHLSNNSSKSDLGLVYMNTRYYVSGIGRFASADTIVPNPMNPQSFNRYTYVGNSPMMFKDINGRCPTMASGDPDRSTNAGSDCWDFLTHDFCNNNLCNNWWEWIIVDATSSWTAGTLGIVRDALLATRDYASSLGLGLDNFLRAPTRFQVGTTCTQNVACHSGYNRGNTYTRSVITIENLGTERNRALFSVIHEIGHAVEHSFAGGAGNLWGSIRDVMMVPPNARETIAFRPYGMNNTETWADAFSATVMQQHTGSNYAQMIGVTDSLNTGWRNADASDRGAMFSALYVAVETVIDGYTP